MFVSRESMQHSSGRGDCSRSIPDIEFRMPGFASSREWERLSCHRPLKQIQSANLRSAKATSIRSTAETIDRSKRRSQTQLEFGCQDWHRDSTSSVVVYKNKFRALYNKSYILMLGNLSISNPWKSSLDPKSNPNPRS